MRDSKKDLWLRLKHYDFRHVVPPQLLDHVAAMFGGADAGTRAFASKLARKLHWSTEFSLRAIEEYRKFAYLGVVSDFSVTPPRKIDQVWHEHLLFSRAYREFCSEVLGQHFDHNPELVPTDEQTGVFSAQYDATLMLYAREFNVAPPRDIWGTPKFPLQYAPRRRRKPLRKSEASTVSDDSSPLHLYFPGGGSSYTGGEATPEFGGGGGFSGGGGGDSWSDAGTGPSPDAGSSGDGGSDGGSGGDGGGSGCSSSCGGGGCSS